MQIVLPVQDKKAAELAFTAVTASWIRSAKEHTNVCQCFPNPRDFYCTICVMTADVLPEKALVAP